MNLNKLISWENSILYIFALGFIMYNIISYSHNSPLGLLSVFVIFNFSLFFFLRRLYDFFFRTIVYFYFIGIIGSFLMFVLNPVYLTFFMAVVFYLSFMMTIKKKEDVDEQEAKSFFVIDVSIFIFFLMTTYYLLKLF